MPRRPIDLGRKIKDILKHVQPLPVEASSPLSHYKRTSTDIWNTLQYVEHAFDQVNLYRAPAQRHRWRINAMVLVNLIESFERFLKELGAACVDHLANYVLDDRFNAFTIHGSGLASHFGTATLGKSLCESGTWLNCKEINDRFRKLLADPFQEGGAPFNLFPKENIAFAILGLVWQIRHTVVHNGGVITQSDAVKLRLWAREPVKSPLVLSPTREDIRYLKRFLDETAQTCNASVGDRLAVLLTALHATDQTLFVPQEKADELTTTFGSPLTVAGATGAVPLP
jgi:hypothetical protein